MERTARFVLRASVAVAIAVCVASAAWAGGEPPGATPGGYGNLSFAAGRFDVAADAYAAALAQSPADADAQLGLATIALMRNRLDDAQRTVDAVLARDATNVRAQRLAGWIRQRRGPAGSYAFAQPRDAVTVPFVATDPLPILHVRVGGRDALFSIDTGAPDIVIDPGLADELHLPTADAGSGVFAGGKRAAVRTTVVSDIELGGVRVADVPADVLPTRNLPFWPGHVADGVIGTGLLSRFLATIDYAHGALVLRARDRSSAFEDEAARRGADRVPMWLYGDHFIFARARIGSAPDALFSVDTGLAGGGLMATKATLDAAHVALDENAAGVGQGGGGPVRVVPFSASATLGSITVPDVQGLYTPGGDPYGIFPFAVGGSISHGFFRQFALTFDFDSMQLVVER